jgi:ABC-2 type transport system ATP-binding protein
MIRKGGNSMQQNKPILHIDQLGYSVEKRVILNGLSLSLDTGQIYSLAGVNGAGKSTLIKIVLDLIRNRDAGTVRVAGVDNRDVSARGNISYLPERFDLKRDISGQQYLQFIGAINRQPWQPEKVEQLCLKLDLDPAYLGKKTGVYSKGMKQKLGLVSCLMQEKPLIILDEPLSGLDPKARYLFKRLVEHQRAAGRTLFYSTHMLADAEEICDRFGVLHQGRIVFEGTPAECLERFQAASLEAAYMRCIGGLEPSQ